MFCPSRTFIGGRTLIRQGRVCFIRVIDIVTIFIIQLYFKNNMFINKFVTAKKYVAYQENIMLDKNFYSLKQMVIGVLQF